MSRTTKMGLPAPYDLKAKRSKSYLTTPMKKLIFYICAISSIGYIIYTVAPKKEQENTYSLDNDTLRQSKEAAVTKKIKEAIDGIPLAEKSSDTKQVKKQHAAKEEVKHETQELIQSKVSNEIISNLV